MRAPGGAGEAPLPERPEDTPMFGAPTLPRIEETELLRLLRSHDLRQHRLSELSGILTGLSMSQDPDGGESRLARWIERCEEIHDEWPVPRMRAALAGVLARGDGYDPASCPGDRRLRAEARRGVRAARGALGRRSEQMEAAPEADFDDPEPLVEFPGRTFVFTGMMVTVDRALAEEATRMLGGEVRPRAVQRADYLVVGSRAHPAWKRSHKGRKIERTELWRSDGRTDCRIVRESAWASAVLRDAQAGSRPGGAAREAGSGPDGDGHPSQPGQPSP